MTLAICLLLVAFLAVMLEIGLPSFGVLSLIGASAYTFSLVLAFKEGGGWGWGFVAAGVVLLPTALALGARVLPNTPLGRVLMLRPPEREEIEQGTRRPGREALRGTEGVTLTDLRPSGAASFSGERIDVISTGGFIRRGGRVRVVEVDGMRVVVEALATEEKKES